MPSEERVPSRRKAIPQRIEGTHEHPARARSPRVGAPPAGDEQRPSPRTGARSATALRALWVVALVAAAAGSATLRHLDEAAVLQQYVAAALGVVLAVGLAVRSGGSALPVLVLTALVGAGAVVSQSPTALAGAAVATAVVAACLAVLGTRPARNPGSTVVEVVLAQLVATTGALAVAGFRVELDADRFGYTVLALSMTAIVALVYRLGGGVHGLGRSGLLLVVAALVVLVAGLAYTAALTRWGSPEIRLDVESARQWLRDTLGGVPHPVSLLLGVPALTWGVSMRSRRRQGWWVCAFGTTATATATARLIQEGESATELLLGATYAVVGGLLIGFVLIRVVPLVVGTPGRRSRRVSAAPGRTEPPRLHPLH